ncbi:MULTISPECIES: hypothetical protein [Amycolatopsis methanolica group]|uniref:hypothetical protein n=1 Tax=Amycolatopsis methanolica group TaxID=2893674 RepID=UPI00341C68DB
MLAKAARNPYVTHQDEFSDLDGVPIIPPMRPATGRATWATVMSPDSADWAGQRGYKLCTAFLPTPAAAGHTVDPTMLGLRRRVFVAASDAEAREKYEASGDKFAAFAGRQPQNLDSEIRSRVMHPDDFANGSPSTVAEN